MDRKQRQRKRKMRLRLNTIKQKFYGTIHSFALKRMVEVIEDDMILVQEMMLEYDNKVEDKTEEMEGSN